uniref:Uncharacterized protein n=1 Tax=Parascaris equorum TaxID=6256 RepID=A0A914S130_PAREQ
MQTSHQKSMRVLSPEASAVLPADHLLHVLHALRRTSGDHGDHGALAHYNMEFIRRHVIELVYLALVVAQEAMEELKRQFVALLLLRLPQLQLPPQLQPQPQPYHLHNGHNGVNGVNAGET